MMGTVEFENEYGEILRPYEDYGILLASFDAPAPSAKIYRLSIDGADGELDLSEWAGEIRYNSRTVTIGLRDMGGLLPSPLAQFLQGRKVKITHSEEPEWYYSGRCDTMPDTRRKRVTDYKLNFTCAPYKMAHTPTIIKRTVTDSAEISLRAVRKTAIPSIVVDDSCTLEYGGNTYSLSAGTHTIPTFLITDRPAILTVTGDVNITIQWRDGVL